MFPESLRRTLAGLLIAAQLFPTLALAGYECSTTTTGSSSGTGLGAVLSVIGDSSITVEGGTGYNDLCGVQFLGSSKVNANTGKFISPGAGNPSNNCKNITHNNDPVIASGQSVSRRTLPTFPSFSPNLSVSLSTSSELSVGESRYSRGSAAQTVTTPDGRRITIPSTASDQVQTIQLPAGDYDAVSAQNGNSIAIAAGSRIKTLSLSGCNGASLIVAPGEYYIESLSLDARCNLNVSESTGTATLNIKNTFTPNGGATCINFSNCGNTTTSNLAAQQPDRLQINVYNLQGQDNGYTAQNNVFIAAGIYIDQGGASIASGPLALVGEVLAAGNISMQNNNQSYLYSKPTSMPGSTTTTTVPATSPNFYTMTPPAIPAVATVGTDYGLRAGQINATAGISGHLKAYLVQSDGNLATTASWDAADKIKDMADADRRAKMKTLDASGHFTTITALMVSDAGVKAYGERILNPNTESGRYLAGRDPNSLIGRPWKTAPIIVGDSVLFAADDGFLYSVDRTAGTLNWAWMPKEILPLAADPGVLMNAHPWGQIATYSVGGKTYVTGSALSGALHFALEVNTAGDQTLGNGPLWTDYREGKSSPAYPFGGDAPQMAVLTEGSAAGKVAYIVDNKLVIRLLNGSDTATENALTTTATSNLFYYSDSELYFGDSAHHVKQVNSSGAEPTSSGAKVMAPNSVDLSITDPIESVTGALVNNESGNSLVLLAQTASRISTLKRNPAGEWASGWYTAVGSSSDGVSSIASGMIITAAPMITKSKA